jgi:hypothetical protein
LVVPTKAIIHPVLATLVAVAENVRRVGLLTAKELASLTMSMRHGLAMATVTMVHTFLPITVAMNVPLA